MSAPRHRKGEPFTEANLVEGETLTSTGGIVRGNHILISDVAGYRYFENYGQFRMSRPMKSYSLNKMRATVDALNRQIEKGNR